MRNSSYVLDNGSVYTMTEWEQKQQMQSFYPNMMKMVHAETSARRQSTSK
jgi:hypothetical protein